MNKNSFIKPFIIFLTILIYTNNIVAHTIILQNIASTAIQSAINGDSFTESLKHQAINTIVMAGANYTANKIGGAYHTGEINKATQLTLHAGLGAITNTLTGNDALSGAIAGVSGEVFAELLGNELYGTTSGNELNSYQQTVLKEYGGLAAGISSLITGKVQDLDVSDIRDDVFAGYRVGKNAVENNLTLYIHGTKFNKQLTEKDKINDQKTADLLAEALNDSGNGKTIEWSGENTIEARNEAAKKIKSYIENYEFAEGEQLNLIGFSHGGNVVKEVTNLDLEYKVDNIVFLATPHVDTHTLNYDVMSENGKIYNFYGTNDYVQDVFAGINFDSIKIYNPSQTINKKDVINIEVNQNPIRNLNIKVINIISPNISEALKIIYMKSTHSNMHSEDTLKQFIIPKITNSK